MTTNNETLGQPVIGSTRSGMGITDASDHLADSTPKAAAQAKLNRRQQIIELEADLAAAHDIIFGLQAALSSERQLLMLEATNATEARAALAAANETIENLRTALTTVKADLAAAQFPPPPRAKDIAISAGVFSAIAVAITIAARRRQAVKSSS